MSRDRLQGFLMGLGAGVLVACFLKPVEQQPADPKSAEQPKPLANTHK